MSENEKDTRAQQKAPGDVGDAVYFDAADDEVSFDDAELIQNGIEQLDFISASAFKPTENWINENITVKGKGYQRPVAKLVGWCNRTSWQENLIPGKPEVAKSIKMEGNFECHSLIEGHEGVKASRVAYLPMKWALKVHEACETFDLAHDPSARVHMVLTIGCRATGKGVPYAWTVHSHLRGARDPDLDRLRAVAFGGVMSAGKRLAGPGGRPRTIDSQLGDSEAAD